LKQNEHRKEEVKGGGKRITSPAADFFSAERGRGKKKNLGM